MLVDVFPSLAVLVLCVAVVSLVVTAGNLRRRVEVIEEALADALYALATKNHPARRALGGKQDELDDWGAL